MNLKRKLIRWVDSRLWWRRELQGPTQNEAVAILVNSYRKQRLREKRERDATLLLAQIIRAGGWPGAAVRATWRLAKRGAWSAWTLFATTIAEIRREK